jgi:hypothetical protein
MNICSLIGINSIELLVEIRALAGGRRMSLEDIQRLLFGQKFDDFASMVAENVEMFHKSFNFRTTAAEGLNELAKLKREMEALRVTHNLPKTNLTNLDFDWDEIGPLMESTLRTSVEDTPAGRVLVAFVRRMNDLVKKHKSVQRAFEELYGLSGMDITPPLHPTNLLAASVFFSSAQEQIKQVAKACNIPLPSLLALLPQLHPYKTPGYSLGIAVDRARQLSGNRTEAGDQIDVDHITFAPYVDVLFVDKRTFTFLNQELRDRPELLVPPPDGRIRFAGTVDKLEQELGL